MAPGLLAGLFCFHGHLCHCAFKYSRKKQDAGEPDPDSQRHHYAGHYFYWGPGAAGETAGSDPESFCDPPGTFPIYLVQNNFPLTDCCMHEYAGLSAGMALYCLHFAAAGMYCIYRWHLCVAGPGTCCPSRYH